MRPSIVPRTHGPDFEMLALTQFSPQRHPLDELIYGDLKISVQNGGQVGVDQVQLAKPSKN